jgi:phosphate transport system protein
MREAFHDQLDAIFADLVDIATQVQTAVRRATEALLEGSAELAEQVITGDAAIDTAREQLEDRAFQLLSLQQPVAGDLRTLVAALRMVADLERMGDLAVHVAKIARLRVPETAVPKDAEPTIRRMAIVAELMVSKAAVVIAERDIAGAAELARADEEMDHLRRSSFRDLLGPQWEHGIEPAIDIALLGRYYERIADHAVSVANRVVYVVTGEVPASTDA